MINQHAYFLSMSENDHENVAYEGIEFRDEILGSATLAFNDLIPRIRMGIKLVIMGRNDLFS